MKNAIQNAGFKLKKVAGKAAFVSTALIGSTTVAMASEGTNYASEAFAEMQSQGSSMIGEAWPILTLIMGALVGMKLFKKFTNRAT